MSDPSRTALKKRVYSQRYVYLLRCKDGSLYCGISTDPEARLKQHNYGVGAKYKMTKDQKERLLDTTNR